MAVGLAQQVSKTWGLFTHSAQLSKIILVLKITEL